MWNTRLWKLQAMVLGCQEALHRAGRVLRYLGRTPLVAEPCCGIGGLRTWAAASGVPYHACFAHDFDSEIEEFYVSLQKSGVEGLGGVACGPVLGDISLVSSEDLPQCEALVSGPPCQPYAPNGRGEGFKDPRSEIFEIVVKWVIHMAWAGSLVCFLLENSVAIASHDFFWKLVDQICLSCPFFLVEVVEQDLKCVLPHSRPRLWLRGLRRDCLVGSCLPPPKSVSEVSRLQLKLSDFLQPGLPNVSPQSLTQTMQANLALYKALALDAMAKGEATAEVMAVELDRNPLRQYGGAVCWDSIPSLRCGGPKIFLVSLPDLSANPSCWEKQKYHRFLSIDERFLLQGHGAELSEHFRTQSAAMAASGNAFNVLQVALMLSPLLEAATTAGVLTKEGVEKLSTTQLAQLIPSGGPQERPKLQRLSPQETATQGQKRKRVRC